MKLIEKMNRAELTAFVQQHLRSEKIDMVLSGGACVSIYSHDKYVSMDLDMIHLSMISPKRSTIRKAMNDLGFIEDGCYFKHPDTDLFVEFPSGPPAVGEEPISEICELKASTGMFKIISPTDCVKDRLAIFYHSDDLQCLNQAILVATENKINMKEVERWSTGEGKSEAFKKIRNRLKIRQ